MRREIMTVQKDSFRYSAEDVANYVIVYCGSKKKIITNLVLQKILYFIEGEFFKYDRDVISEDFCAWKLGPVIPSVYETFSIYGGSRLLPSSKQPGEIREKDKEIIDAVVDKWIDVPVWEIVRVTHDTDPWKDTYDIFGRWARISKSSMKRYFETIEKIRRS